MAKNKIVKKIINSFNKWLKGRLWALVFFIILILLAIFLFLFFHKELINILSYFDKNNPSISGMILFEGNDCSHCVTVDNFITNNNIEDKIKFTRLEVFDNSVNANILEDKAQICGLDDSHMGVPFLWDGEHCIVGYVDVIKFFQDKIAEKQ